MRARVAAQPYRSPTACRARARWHPPNPAPAPLPPPPTRAAADTCTTIVSGYTPLFGVPQVKPTDKYVDQLGAWKAGGDITKMSMYYSHSYGCIFGVKPTYGESAALFGVEDRLQGVTMALNQGEYFTEAEYKAGGK